MISSNSKIPEDGIHNYSRQVMCCKQRLEKTGGETEKMNEIITEQTGFPEKMPVDTEVISEQINDIPEIIDTNTEQIDEFSEIIPEKMTEKKRYRGQRGQDKTPRLLNNNSLMNLKPFKSNAVILESEETTRLSDDEVKIICIIVLIAIFGVVVWKTIEWLREPVCF